LSADFEILIIGMGSSHDASVYQRMGIAQHPTRYFEWKEDYLLGDSAYPLSNHLIHPFTQAVLKQPNTAAEHLFNVRLSSARVNVEHAIGLVKLRFAILQ